MSMGFQVISLEASHSVFRAITNVCLLSIWDGLFLLSTGRSKNQFDREDTVYFMAKTEGWIIE